jgi:hypothetical protein
MASIVRAPKQTGGYYVPLGNLVNQILAWTPGSGAGGSYQSGSFAVAGWASTNSATASPYTSSISTIGASGVLRDEGKTVVSAGRVFRKVQLLVNTVSTAGVGGAAPGATANTDYLTGYIERPSGAINGLGGVGTGAAFQGSSVAPVAFIPALY